MERKEQHAGRGYGRDYTLKAFADMVHSAHRRRFCYRFLAKYLLLRSIRIAPSEIEYTTAAHAMLKKNLLPLLKKKKAPAKLIFWPRTFSVRNNLNLSSMRGGEC